MQEEQIETTPSRDEWDDLRRWLSKGGPDYPAGYARKLHAAYRLGRFRGYVQGDGVGRQKGFGALFNLLVDLRDKAIAEQEDALRNQRHALAKMHGRTRYALDTALGLVQQMFVIAEASASMKARPEPESEPES